MKILLLTQNYYPSTGGGIRYKVAFVRIFRSLGHTVDILCTNTRNKLSIEEEVGGRIIRTPQWKRMGSTAISPATFKWFKKIAHEYGHLHFNFPSPFTDMALVHYGKSLKGKAELSCYYHADIVPEKPGAGPYNRYYTKKFLEMLDTILVSNPRIVDSSAHLQSFKDKAKVCPFGIDAVGHFGISQEKFIQLTQNAQPYNEVLKVLFVGRLSRYKGIDVLMEACSNLNVELNIVGTGPLERSLIERAKDVNCEVKFHGFVQDEDLPQLYYDADVFVLPSIDEGEAFGYVLIEAMQFGCALISTEVGTGTSWINQDSITGLVCAPSHIEQLRVSLQKFVDDHDFLNSCKRESIQRFKSTFALDAMKVNLIKSLNLG